MTTESTKPTRKITIMIQRYIPEKDSKPHWESYPMDVARGTTVLEAIHEVKQFHQQDIAHRFSCRMGVCGSCAMLVNGLPMLACNTQVWDVAGDKLTIAPLPNFDIIKDLVPDLVPMIETHASLKTHLVRNDVDEQENPLREYAQSPAQLEEYLQFSYCIKCGACMAACPTMATDRRFMGPMPLAAAFRYDNDSRDAAGDTRRDLVGAPHGVMHCHFGSECSRVCPKGVDPAKAIQLMKRSMVLGILRLFTKKKPAGLVAEPKGVGRMDGVPDAPAYTVEGATSGD